MKWYSQKILDWIFQWTCKHQIDIVTIQDNICAYLPSLITEKLSVEINYTEFKSLRGKKYKCYVHFVIILFGHILQVYFEGQLILLPVLFSFSFSLGSFKQYSRCMSTTQAKTQVSNKWQLGKPDMDFSVKLLLLWSFLIQLFSTELYLVGLRA